MQPQPFLSTPEKGTHSPWPHSAHTEVGSWIRETALARVFHRRDGAEALAELLLAVSGKPQEEGDQKKLDDRSEPLAPYHQVQEATLSAFLGFSIHQLQHVPLSADFSRGIFMTLASSHGGSSPWFCVLAAGDKFNQPKLGVLLQQIILFISRSRTAGMIFVETHTVRHLRLCTCP